MSFKDSSKSLLKKGVWPDEIGNTINYLNPLQASNSLCLIL